ncbi:MAG TPA: S1/P1 nuclease [Pyrinomonadaceae bacterium]|nr:S1/P1 nuclease [Pyrinomonadaceae bacterium]
MKKLFRAVLLCALVVSAQSSALAWHDTGHMIVAQVAYLRLTPAAKAKVDAMFAPPQGTRRPLIFLCAGYYMADTCEKIYDPITIAVWMDDFRGDSLNSPLYDNWHYVDYPFFDGVPESTKAGPEPENALARINWAFNSLREMQNEKREEPGRAKREAELTGFLYHLVGDVHQPLHATTRVTAANPTGDAGGNFFKLSMPQEPRVTNLHFFWDAAGGAFGFQGPKRPLDQAGKDRIRTLAEAVMKDYPADSMPESKNLNPHDWAMESYALAVSVTYKNITEGSAPSKAYTEETQKLARKRFALAGYRLAGVLNSLFVAEAPKPSPAPANN